MKLFGANGTTFKLTVLGYEFPGMISEPYDSNWLIIEVDVATPQRLWRASDPSLLTYEVERLAHWLEQIANGIPDDQTCGLIEPQGHRISFCIAITFERGLGVCGGRGTSAELEQGVGVAGGAAALLLAALL